MREHEAEGIASSLSASSYGDFDSNLVQKHDHGVAGSRPAAKVVVDVGKDRLTCRRRDERHAPEARIRVFDESVSSTAAGGRERRPISSQLQQKVLAEHLAQYAPTTQVSGKKGPICLA
jgi:hypothetical protein